MATEVKSDVPHGGDPGKTELMVPMTVIDIDGTVIIIKSAYINAEHGANRLAETVPELRPAVLQGMVEAGALVFESAQMSATVQLMGERIERFSETLIGDFVKVLNEARSTGVTDLNEFLNGPMQKLLVNSLHQFERTVGNQQKMVGERLTTYLDPESTRSVPFTVSKMLTTFTLENRKVMEAMLVGSDPTSPIAILKDELKKAVDQAKNDILMEVARQRTRQGETVHGGRSYQEALSVRVGELVRPLGDQVELVADTTGAKLTKKGDVVLTLDMASARGAAIRVVLEAKKKKGTISEQEIRAELRAARENRQAETGLFVVEDGACLKNGALGLIQVGPEDFAVVWCEQTGDLALALAIRASRLAALEKVKGAGVSIDMDACRKVIGQIRQRLESFAVAESSLEHSSKDIDKAKLVLDSIRADISSDLRRLDAMLAS